MSTAQTASQVWGTLRTGNLNFMAGTPAHPRQDAELRKSVAVEQRPIAAIFGCSDSRLGAEMIFDVGLGDLFVVRNAGQVIAETILGSLEFAVEVLGVPLIIVLGHDQCGAVKAAMSSADGDLKLSGNTSTT
jgi:Carbonic anhydrase